MANTTDSVKFSETERAILETALQNPDLTNAEIAEEVGARLTLVRDTRNEYEDEVELAEGVGDDDPETASADAADPGDTQAAIIEAAKADPGKSNAEIAEEVGARIALVRDTRAAHGVEFDPTATSESDDATQPSESDADAEPSDLQAEILELAENNPELTNAEIAEEVGARLTLVRDTRSQFDSEASAAADTDGSDDADDSTSAAAEIDTDGFSELQVEILETAAAHPEATNAEIAEEVGARLTLVRDTIYEHESDDTASTDDDAAESDDGTDVLEAVDTAAFSGTQLDILETALANPELTNAEIAEQTGTRITLVRDTIHDHEYDEKPWVGNVEEDADEDDEDDATAVSPDEEEIEMPETTDSDLLSAVEQAILEAALENADLTNAEIAEHTGARLTLVRDTRATYEEAVELPAEDDEGDGAVTAGSTAPGEPTETQHEILEAAAADPEATNAELAERTGTRIPLVRDTLATYDADAAAGAADSTEADSEADTSAETDTTDAAASADTESGGISAGPIVAILIALALALAVAASLGVI